jgi:GTPase KRas protein
VATSRSFICQFPTRNATALKKQFISLFAILTMEQQSSDESIIRLGIFGGGGVGKTAITLRLLRHSFIPEYFPTVGDEFATDISVGKKSYHLQIIDTAGQQDFRELRASFYSYVQRFLLVYSVIDRESLYEVEDIARSK